MNEPEGPEIVEIIGIILCLLIAIGSTFAFREWEMKRFAQILKESK